jgi:anti-anti-sigma factor
MTLDIRTGDGLSIVILPERLDSTNAGPAEEELPAVLSAGLPVILDASRCRYISSAGLRLLLMVAKRLVPARCVVVVVGMTDSLIEIMRITGFDHMFAFYPDLEQAIGTVKTGSSHAQG